MTAPQGTHSNAETLAVCRINARHQNASEFVAAYLLVHLDARGQVLDCARVFAQPGRPRSAASDALIDAIHHEWLAAHANITAVAVSRQIIDRVLLEDLPPQERSIAVLPASREVDAIAVETTRRWRVSTNRTCDWLSQNGRGFQPLFLRPLLRGHLIMMSDPENIWPVTAKQMHLAADLAGEMGDAPFWSVRARLPPPAHPIWHRFNRREWNFADQAHLLVVALALRNAEPETNYQPTLCVDIPTCLKDAIEDELTRRNHQHTA